MGANNSQAGVFSVLDFLKFDITNFFAGEYKEIQTTDTPAIQIIEFEKKLTEKEFDVFDSVRLVVMFDKYVISADTHINVLYRTKKKRLSLDEIKNTTLFLHGKLGTDDAQRHSWTKEDEDGLVDFTFSRIWPIGTGESFVNKN